MSTTEFGPHDIRGWTADDILLGVYAGAELWDSTDGDDPGDVLGDEQRELLDKAADVLADELDGVLGDEGAGGKLAPLRTWDTTTLALTLRAAGIWWQDTGGSDPHDVLSSVQKQRLDRAAQLVLTADDLARLG